MKEYKNIIINTLYIILGIVLIVLVFMNEVNSLFAGFGGGLLGVGVVQLIRAIKYKTNSEYKEMVDTKTNDERNRFISMKAWSWAAYSFIMICAAITIICLIMSKVTYMQIAAGIICVMLVLYYICYLIVSKKY